jgi:hypothetical protein
MTTEYQKEEKDQECRIYRCKRYRNFNELSSLPDDSAVEEANDAYTVPQEEDNFLRTHRSSA